MQVLARFAYPQTIDDAMALAGGGDKEVAGCQHFDGVKEAP